MAATRSSAFSCPRARPRSGQGNSLRESSATQARPVTRGRPAGASLARASRIWLVSSRMSLRVVTVSPVGSPGAQRAADRSSALSPTAGTCPCCDPHRGRFAHGRIVKWWGVADCLACSSSAVAAGITYRPRFDGSARATGSSTDAAALASAPPAWRRLRLARDEGRDRDDPRPHAAARSATRG